MSFSMDSNEVFFGKSQAYFFILYELSKHVYVQQLLEAH